MIIKKIVYVKTGTKIKKIITSIMLATSSLPPPRPPPPRARCTKRIGTQPATRRVFPLSLKRCLVRPDLETLRGDDAAGVSSSSADNDDDGDNSGSFTGTGGSGESACSKVRRIAATTPWRSAAPARVSWRGKRIKRRASERSKRRTFTGSRPSIVRARRVAEGDDRRSTSFRR